MCIKVFEVADRESGIYFILPDIPEFIPDNGRTSQKSKKIETLNF